MNHSPDDMLEEIREVNLCYLLLAQRMLRQDRPTGMYRLGVSSEVADVLVNLTSAQTVRIATSNVLLSRFRFNDHILLSALVETGRRVGGIVEVHAAIVLAGQSAEQL
jgi:flagellar transcriptional activator FlhD